MSYSAWQEESPTAQHYRGLLNNRPSLTFQDTLDSALQGRDRGSAFSAPKLSQLASGALTAHHLISAHHVNSSRRCDLCYVCAM